MQFYDLLKNAKVLEDLKPCISFIKPAVVNQLYFSYWNVY